MTLELIGEHSIDTSLLTPGGWVLDAGCRDFIFSRGLVERGCRVLALDADPTIEDPKIPGVTFRNVALSTKEGAAEFVMTSDPQARFLGGVNPPAQAPKTTVPTISLPALMRTMEIARFDVVKLDVEGAEYDILLAWPSRIATQLSIEFHEHVRPRPSWTYVKIFERLTDMGYVVIQHEKTARYCCAPNYFDTLLVAR